MNESYREGIASQPGPQPCEGAARPHLKGNGVRYRYFVAAGARVQVAGWRIPLSAQKRVVGLRHERGSAEVAQSSFLCGS
jgi:hypothetical protein